MYHVNRTLILVFDVLCTVWITSLCCFLFILSQLLNSCVRALLWSCFSGSCSVVPFTPDCHSDFSVFRGCGARFWDPKAGEASPLTEPTCVTKDQGQFQGGDTSLTCLELSFPGTALGWVLHCPFWISGVTQVNYPVLVIWMRDNSKLLKTDIFPSQLPISAARDKCSRALWVDVVLLNVMRGKGSAVKCDGSLSQLSGIYCWALSIM